MPKNERAAVLAAVLASCLGSLAPAATGQALGGSLEETWKDLGSPSTARRLAAAQALAAAADPVWRSAIRQLASTGEALEGQARELVAALGDERWPVREEAEQRLVVLGPAIIPILEAAALENGLLERRWRAARALAEIRRQAGEQAAAQEERARILRGLVWALGVAPPAPQRRAEALAALRLATGDLDQQLRLEACWVRAYWKDRDVLPVLQQLLADQDPWPALSGLIGMGWLGGGEARPGLEAAARGEVAPGGTKTPLLRMAAGWELRRLGFPSAFPILAGFPGTWAEVPLLSAGAAEAPWSLWVDETERLEVRDAALGLGGLAFTLPGGGRVFLPLKDLERLAPAAGEPASAAALGRWILLRSGSCLPGEVLSLDGETAALASPLAGDRKIPRAWLQAWGSRGQPGLETVVPRGGDLVRLEGGSQREGSGVTLAEGRLRLLGPEGPEVPANQVELCALAASRGGDPPWADPLQVLLAHTVRLRGGGELKALLLDGGPGGFLALEPCLGPLVLPVERVGCILFRTGFSSSLSLTLVADYDQNEVFEVDGSGRRVWALKDLEGPWDAEWLPDGHLLLCEQATSRVRELTREGQVVWEYGHVSLPYDADRLPDGSYLIADTGHKRVIQVAPDGRILWELPAMEAYDVERLPGGNTLLADPLGGRVLEVRPDGSVAWQAKGLQGAVDADRLANGHTLVTCRANHTVVEVDREGRVVWRLTGLDTPNDADRLPGGLTLVAESGQVRLFDQRGQSTWSIPAGWAGEANRY